MKGFVLRTCLTLAAVGAIALVGTMPASAADTPLGEQSERDYVIGLEASLDSASPQQIAALSASDRALLTKYAQVSQVSSSYVVRQIASTDPSVAELVSAAAVTSCYTATSSRTATGIVGNSLYRSWHVGRWCKTGSTVTSASRVEQGTETYWLGWSSKGLIGGSAAVVSNQGRSYSQHSFQFQLGTPSPTQFVQPCTRVRGTAVPSFFADYVCGLYS